MAPGTTVRVRFLEGDPELQIPAPEPTMNYGHEHQNPDTPIDWNRAAVIADLSGPDNNWDEATIGSNIEAATGRRVPDPTGDDATYGGWRLP